MHIARIVLAALCLLCVHTHAKAFDDATAQACVLGIANDIKTLPKTSYAAFIAEVFDLDAAITKGTMVRGWKNVPSRAETWPNIARNVITSRTLPALKGIDIDNIRPRTIHVRGTGRSRNVSGVTTEGTEISVSVRQGGARGCLVTDAAAMQQSISGLIGSAIEQHERASRK